MRGVPLGIPRRVPLVLAAGLVAMGLTVTAGIVDPKPAFADPAAGPNALSFAAAGAIPGGVIPDGTCFAVVTALGGSGASSGLNDTTGGAGGRAAQIKATFSVVPGQPYSGIVGGGGTSGGIGGFNGGGTGGTVTGGHRGGGGGGSTSFVIAGQTLMVAGGGGGGGAAHSPSPAGSAGNAGVISGPGVAVGTNGTDGVDSGGTPRGGSGGAVTAGGLGGVNTGNAGRNGFAGGGIGAGVGGNGGADTWDSGGGGGAGYTGGGGGASTAVDSVSGAGGGGGSSFLIGTSPDLAGTPTSAIVGSQGAVMGSRSVNGPSGQLSVDWIPCRYDLLVKKAVSVPTVSRGDTVTWTVSVTNNGPHAMTKGDTIDLTDTLPLGPNGATSPTFKVLSLSTTGGTNSEFASGAVTCTGLSVGATMPAATNCSRTYAPLAGTPGSPTGGTRGLNVGETLTIVYEQHISETAPCPTTITNVAAVKDRATQTGTTDIVGVIATKSASAPLNIACNDPKVKIVKALDGARLAGSDQFTVAIAPSGAAPTGGSATTSGTGSTIVANSGVVVVSPATAGQTYTFSETMAAGSASALSQYSSTVTCVNAKAGSTTPLPAAGSSAVPFAVRPAAGDDITCTLTNKPLRSALTIVKGTTSTGFNTLGALIPYTFVVTNTGQTTLQSITITDPNASGIACDVTTLAPAAVANCTGTHTVTQADLDAGKVDNTASVTGTPPGGSPIPPTLSTLVTVPGTQTPRLTITKSTTKLNFSAVGETIPYSFIVRNEGNVTLTSIVVSDPQTSGVSCVAAALAPGQSTTCTGSHIVTLADLNTGSVTNIASVTGATPSGSSTAPVQSNQVVVPAVQKPELSIVKSSTLTSYSTLNATVPYTFTVSNTGNVTLIDITVTDANTSGVTCAATTLDPGASTTCTGSHTVTQTDLDSGSISNTAQVVGTPPSGVVTPPVLSNTVTIPATAAPQITITKATTATTYTTVGALVPYTFVVENRGNVTLSSVVVTDPQLTSVTCVATTLAPGATTTCAGSHVVTQADLDAGSIVNIASVGAQTPNGKPLPAVNSNQVSVPATQTPSLSILKKTDKVSFAAVGELIPYTFTVENTGNVTITSVNVTDPKTGPVLCPDTTLSPGEVTICTGTHTVTQADLDAGSVVNQASVGGTPPSGTPLPPVTSAPVTTPAVQNPQLAVLKASATPSYSAVGDQIDYTFKVTNTGNVSMNSVVVTDPIVSNITCPTSTLAPGASTTCTGSRLATSADISATNVVNTASVGGQTPAGVAIPAVNSNTVTVPLLPLPSIKITKSADKTVVSSLTDVITYTFVVTNTGNVTISNFTVSDPQASAITCDTASLPLGGVATCTGTHAVTAADLDAGSVINTAAVNATPSSGPAIPTTSSNTVTVPVTQTPQLTLVKATTATQYSTLNQVIQYTFQVTNTGNVTINSISVTDGNATGIVCPVTTLAAGASTTCTGSHTVTQADLDSGSVINQAQVGGTPPSGAPLAPVSSNIVTVPATQLAGLTITKATTKLNFSAVGESIPYTFEVINTGNVTLTNVTVSDPNATGVNCPATSLAPGASTLCTGNHVVTQADLDSGSVVNTASVVGTPPSGVPTAPVPSNQITVPAVQVPGITISKSTTKPNYVAVGETIPYSFVVLNTGNVTLTSVTVTDPLAPGITCTPTTLSPGQQANCTGSHTVTQADLDAGAVINTAQVSATPPIGGPLAPVDSNTVAVPATQTPQLDIVKATAKPNYSSVGEPIEYTFTVTNSGNVTISDIAVSDPIAGVVTCSTTTLAPTASVTCTATRLATQADLDAGAIINSASVVGATPDGTPLAPVGSNYVTVPAIQNPSLSVDKSSPTADYDAVGDIVDYSFVVTNRGNVTMSNIVVSDPLVSGLTCVASTLAPGASTTCSGTHTVTQADLDAGKIVNTAQVSGVKPNGTSVPPVDSNTVIVPAIQTPLLTIDKSSSTASYSTVGSDINYTFVVTNAGNVTMTSISIVDPLVAGISCPATTLAPGDSMTCNGTHKVTQTDLDRGSVVNIATVGGTPPNGTPLAPVPSNPVTVPADQNPALTIVKGTSATTFTTINDVVNYTFTITNSGNVTMTNVGLNDPVVFGVSCSNSVLAPGASTVCTAQHIVTAADLDSGSISNTATAVGTPPSGTPIPPVPSNTVVIPATQLPSLSLTKSTSTGSYQAVGEVVNYLFRVTNTGNVTMSNITINDPKLGPITCIPTTLGAGEMGECTGSHVVTQADLDGGSVINTATVTATSPSGAQLPPVPSNTVTVPAIQDPQLSIVKSTSNTNYAAVGQVVDYSFLVTNAGNVTVTNVVVVDLQTSGVTCPSATLAVGASMTCTGTHIVTQQDLDRSFVDNTASVDGTDPTGEEVGPLPSNTVSVPAVVKPSLQIVKAYTGPTLTRAGDIATYEFTVTNDGNVTMLLVDVKDPKLTSLTCVSSTLAPTQTTTCTGQHVVTQAEVDAGRLVNTGFVTGQPPVGSPIAPIPSNEVVVPIAPNPLLSVTKATTATAFSQVGDVLTYTFEVTNRGNVTMTNVTVSDPLVSGLSCLAGSLAPGERTECVGSHTVNQADLDAGAVVNTASVSGTQPSGVPVPPTPSNTVTVGAVQTPGIVIAKATTLSSVAVVGTNIPYTFELTNSGNVTLTDIIVTDPMVIDMQCPTTVLTPGQKIVCTAKHPVTLADLNAGSIVNTAQVSATPPASAPPLAPVDSNTVTVPVIQKPALSIGKAANVARFNTVGDVIPYTFTVTNTGNVTIANIAVSDPKTSPVMCEQTTLEPTFSTTCTGQHTVTQADIDAEEVVNTASVTGTSPNGRPLPPASSNTVTVPAVVSPLLSIVKSTNTTTVTQLGESVVYSFLVSNDGNVTLNDVTISDAKVDSIVCDVTSLAPDEQATCTGTHLVTQAELDFGAVENTASVTGTTPLGTSLALVNSNAVIVPVVQTPKLAIVKASGSSAYSAVGQAVPYSFVVTNTGNVTLTALTIDDPSTGAIVCPQTQLAPEESITCTANHIVTQIDLDAGAVVNTATVRATPPSGTPMAPSTSNTVTVPATQVNSLTIVKAALTPSVASVGAAIDYTFVVTNSGNLTSSNIAVQDPITGAVSCPRTQLSPTESMTCTAKRVTTQADLDAGKVVNVATVTASAPDGTVLPAIPSNEVIVPVAVTTSLSIVKSTADTKTFRELTDIVQYDFVVTNTGNVTVKNIAVNDPKTGPVLCQTTTLAPAQQTTCTASLKVSADDKRAGFITNTATVSGQDPFEKPTEPTKSNEVQIPVLPWPEPKIPSSETTPEAPETLPPITSLPPVPTPSSVTPSQPARTGIRLDKSASTSFESVGDVVKYQFTITNTGTAPLANVKLNDAMAGLSEPKCAGFDGSLDAGESVTCTATYKVTNDDVTRGSITNTASATATDPTGNSATMVLSNDEAKTMLISPTTLSLTGSDVGRLTAIGGTLIGLGALLLIARRRRV